MITLNKEEILHFVARNPAHYEFTSQEIKGRLNVDENISTKDIQKMFIEKIYEPLNDADVEKITPLTQKAESELYSILHKVGITISEPMKWRIIKANNGYNWNTCYTKGSVIILSQKAIDKDQNLVRTLAHEMIHVYQRKHPKLFRQFYKKKMGFSDFNPTEKQLESMDELGIGDIYVENPDYCEIGLMIYKEKYLPISVILPNEKQPVNIVLELNGDSVEWKDKNTHQMNGYDKQNLDQPNEMFAYMTTKKIT
jgi:predicted metal-dependent hydrolase